VALGLYVHVPFCAAICNYCNFNRGLFDAALKARYVDALLTEIGAAREPATAADTIFFGGGTPSLLEPAEVGSIIAACRESFDVARDAEITLEANPETVTIERLEQFRTAGVNRLSYGVQSFRDDELSRLSRLHSATRAREAFAMARAAGFDNVSLDLMMWLPQQSVAQWLQSVDALIDVGPDHASLYLLELYPNAPLRDEMARGQWSLAPDDDAAEMYLEAMARLDAAGYEQYEISNVARCLPEGLGGLPSGLPKGLSGRPSDLPEGLSGRPSDLPEGLKSLPSGLPEDRDDLPYPGRASRHNLKYWEDGEWRGFGCGAHSTRGGVRWKNLSATGDYIAAVSGGAPLAVDRRELSAEERIEDALFTGLRLARGIEVAAFRRRYGVDVWDRYGRELQPFVDAGLLIYDCRLRLTRAGMLLAHEIMTVFISANVR
jgi:oxygen-independent coproporphyrinogen-3 oxidase